MEATIQNNINNRFIESVCKGNVDEMKLLIDLGADIHIHNDEALRLCAKYFHIEAAKILLEKGLDINACVTNGNPNEEGKTALHYAAQAGHMEMVTFLLDNKADIEQRSDLKQNALHNAVDNNKMEVVKLLLERGANIHAKGFGEKEDYALLLSAIRNLPKMMEFLLEKGANVNANDDYILRSCAQYHNIGVLRILVGFGANASNNMAMINAIKNDNIECVKLLLDNGANMYANGGYECAISVYRNNGSIVELLLGIIYVF